jgi:hypothetical protein
VYSDARHRVFLFDEIVYSWYLWLSPISRKGGRMDWKAKQKAMRKVKPCPHCDWQLVYCVDKNSRSVKVLVGGHLQVLHRCSRCDAAGMKRRYIILDGRIEGVEWKNGWRKKEPKKSQTQ